LAGSRINRGMGRREELRKRAEELASYRASRSSSEQLALLDDRLGVGVGAVRERAKLLELIKEESRKKEKPVKHKTGNEKKDRRERRRAKARRDASKRSTSES